MCIRRVREHAIKVAPSRNTHFTVVMDRDAKVGISILKNAAHDVQYRLQTRTQLIGSGGYRREGMRGWETLVPRFVAARPIASPAGVVGGWADNVTQLSRHRAQQGRAAKIRRGGEAPERGGSGRYVVVCGWCSREQRLA